MINLNEVLPGKCIVCFSRGNLRRYAGHFRWLTASICSTCEAECAEPLGAVLLWIAVNGGPDACADVAGDWVIYNPPDFVGWEAIRRVYTQEIDGILSLIESELGHEYAQAFRSGRPSRIN